MLALLALGGFLALRGIGSLAAIPAFIGVLIAWLFRHGGGFLLGRLLSGLLGRAATAAAGGGPQAGTSQVQGLVLSMTLDHASGDLEGEVLSGPLAGRALRSLSTEEMRALYAECSVRCERSLRLLESWLDRYGGDWRAHVDPARQGAAAATGPMTRAEALRVLGLDDDQMRKHPSRPSSPADSPPSGCRRDGSSGGDGQRGARCTGGGAGRARLTRAAERAAGDAGLVSRPGPEFDARHHLDLELSRVGRTNSPVPMSPARGGRGFTVVPCGPPVANGVRSRASRPPHGSRGSARRCPEVGFPSPPGVTGHVRYPRGLGACINKAVGRGGDVRGHAGGADDGRAAVRAPAMKPRQLVDSGFMCSSLMDYSICNKQIWIQVCRHKHFPQPRSTARDSRDRLCARSFGLRSSGGSRSRNK